MELKLFTDLIDALGKVSGSLKTIVNLPKAERETIRRTLDETYRLIDMTLNMVVIRLGDILPQESADDFLHEIVRLDNYNERAKAEQQFRFCHSLHVALREMEMVIGRIAGPVSTRAETLCFSKYTPPSPPNARSPCSLASTAGFIGVGTDYMAAK